MYRGDTYYRKNQELSDIVDQFDKEEDDDIPLYKKLKTSHLGFKKGDTVAYIKDLRDANKTLTEDGHVMTKSEDGKFVMSDSNEPPWGPAYYNVMVEKLKLMEKNHDFRFVTLLAGAMGRSAHELYEEEDLERKRLENEANRTRIRLEYERTILPVKKKKEELLFLKNERDTLQDLLLDKEGESTFNDLNQNGELLINDYDGKEHPRRGVARLWLTKLDLDIMRGITDDIDPTIVNKRMTSVLGGNIEKTNFTTEEKSTFAYLTLFKYLLDNNEEGQHVYYLFDAITSHMATSKASINPESARIPTEIIVSYKPVKWLGTKTVDTTHTKAVFNDEDDIWKMVTKGVELEFNDHEITDENKNQIKYKDMVLALMRNTGNDQDKFKGTGIYRSIKKDKHHPDDILKLLGTVRDDIYANESSVQDENTRELLKGHFIWYFLNKAIQDPKIFTNLKIENIKTDPDPRLKQLKNLPVSIAFLLNSVEPYLGKYFNDMVQLLSLPKLPEIPEKKEEEEEGELIIVKPRPRVFEFPIYMKVFNTGVFKVQNETLKEKNLETLIIYNPFLKFYKYNIGPDGKKLTDEEITKLFETPKENNDEYIKKTYPILELEHIFAMYNKFTHLERSVILNRIQYIDESVANIEAKIADISQEKNDFSFMSEQQLPYFKNTRSFNSQPINNGVIRLKADVIAHMEKAYRKVQQHCSALRGMPLEAFQADHAFDSGLTGAFANYVAALIAETQLTFPNAYKSLAMQRHVLSHVTNTFNELKKYRATKSSTGDFKTRVDVGGGKRVRGTVLMF